MISYPVRQGRVGVSNSHTKGLVLLQVTEENEDLTSQSRAVMTCNQALDVAARLIQAAVGPKNAMGDGFASALSDLRDKLRRGEG